MDQSDTSKNYRFTSFTPIHFKYTRNRSFTQLLSLLKSNFQPALIIFLVIGGLKSVCIKSNDCKWFMYLFPGTVRRHAVSANVLSAISYMQGHASS